MYEKAITHYLKAYAICDKENDRYSLVALLKKMAPARKALKQHDEAIKIYLNVIDLYSGYNNPAGTVATMEELAEFYLEIGERQKSADTFRTIASIHKNFKHTLQAKEFTDKAAQVEQGTI
jgi:tetratricopeptide (TPR) repeat protein